MVGSAQLEGLMQFAAMVMIAASLIGPEACPDAPSGVDDEKFVLAEGYGCETRTSDWRQDGTWTVADYTGCMTDFETPAPDQVGRFRFAQTGDGPTMVEFSLFPEDGVLRAHLCKAE